MSDSTSEEQNKRSRYSLGKFNQKKQSRSILDSDDDNDKEIKELENENKKLRTQIRTLKTELRAEKEKYENLEDTNEDKDKKIAKDIKKLKTEAKEKEDEIEESYKIKLKEQLDESKNEYYLEINNIKNELKAEKSKNIDLNSNIEDLNAEIGNMKMKMNETETELKKTKGNYEGSMKMKMNETETELKKSKENYEELETEVKQLNAQIRNLKGFVKDEQEKYSILEDTIEATDKKSNKEIKKLKAEIKEKEDEIEELNESFKQKLKENKASSNDYKLNEYEQEINKIKNELNEEKSKNLETNKIKNELNEEKSKNSQLNSKIKDLESELKLKSRKDNYDDANKEIYELKDIIETTKAELEKKTCAIETMRKRLQDGTRNAISKDEYERLQLQLNARENDIKKLNEKQIKTEDDLAMKTKDVAILIKEIENMKQLKFNRGVNLN